MVKYTHVMLGLIVLAAERRNNELTIMLDEERSRNSQLTRDGNLCRRELDEVKRENYQLRRRLEIQKVCENREYVSKSSIYLP